MNNLHIFLGATVADAAARPLHWVYDPKKLKKYIKGKKEIAFLKKNRSPFYNIITGNFRMRLRTLVDGQSRNFLK